MPPALVYEARGLQHAQRRLMAWLRQMEEDEEGREQEDELGVAGLQGAVAGSLWQVRA